MDVETLRAYFLSRDEIRGSWFVVRGSWLVVRGPWSVVSDP